MLENSTTNVNAEKKKTETAKKGHMRRKKKTVYINDAFMGKNGYEKICVTHFLFV